MKATDARLMTLDQLNDELVKLKRSGSTCDSSARPVSSRIRRECGRCGATSPGSRPSRARSASPNPGRSEEIGMPKRMLQGTVVGDKQDKTVIVRVERRFTHPLLKKTVRRTKKYHAHDEKNEFSVGDIVWIEEHRPISRLKRWAVARGEKRAK